MPKEDLTVKNKQNADLICSKIEERAKTECEQILARSNREVVRIFDEAKKEAEEKRREVLVQADSEREKLREKVFSTLNLEKRRMILETRDRFAKAVLKAVSDLAQNFRNSSEYPGFLKKAVLESAAVLDTAGIAVCYSSLDERFFTPEFTRQAQEEIRARLNKPVIIELRKEDFKDIGVVVVSQDGRLVFDNRFAARLKRNYDRIYLELLKEFFPTEGVSA